MEHDEIRSLIHSYADGELDAINLRLVADHLQSCADCRRAEQTILDLRTALRDSAPAFSAPTNLRKKIRADIRRETAGDSERKSSWSWLSFALGTACAVLLLGTIFLPSYRGRSGNAVADQVVANHVRSLLASHLVDVPSSDQHTVKPWFDGKVDFAPPVHDFGADGFPLVGGRLDYLDGKTVVALVYRRHQHPINLLISPTPGRANTSPQAMTRRGYNLIHWTQDEMSYWAVSDLNAAELDQFAAHVTAGK
jgi:anti-sigma factor RsiW